MIDRSIAQSVSGADSRFDLVISPKLGFTTFSPRLFVKYISKIGIWFEESMPDSTTNILLQTSKKYEIGFQLAFTELVKTKEINQRFNCSILIDKTGEIIGKYKKIHLPGHSYHQPWRESQHLEKLYPDKGDLGFAVFNAFGGKIGMCFCNYRSWLETYIIMGLQEVEIITLGYNTPVQNQVHLNPMHWGDYIIRSLCNQVLIRTAPGF